MRKYLSRYLPRYLNLQNAVSLLLLSGAIGLMLLPEPKAQQIVPAADEQVEPVAPAPAAPKPAAPKPAAPKTDTGDDPEPQPIHPPAAAPVPVTVDPPAQLPRDDDFPRQPQTPAPDTRPEPASPSYTHDCPHRRRSLFRRW